MGLSLMFASAGKDYEIIDVKGDENLKKHLHDLAFVSGVNVSVVSVERGGITLKLGSAKLALDRSVASKIYVKELEKEKFEYDENNM